LRSLAEATIDLIDALAPAEFLAAITPERLGQATGYAPSSIRYQLTKARPAGGEEGPRSWAFDRELLLIAVVEVLLDRLRAADDHAASVYVAALQNAARTGDLSEVSAAIRAQAGPDSGGPQQGSARPYHLALALAVANPNGPVAQTIEQEHSRRLVKFVPAGELMLRITQRIPRAGSSVVDIVGQINVALERALTPARRHSDTDFHNAMRSAIAIFCAFSAPAAGLEAANVVDELFVRLFPPADPQ
jgi:hypothetical protein